MTCTHQDCQNCPHRPKSEYHAAQFDRDVAMRSLEYAAIRLGMHWNPGRDEDVEIAALPSITDAGIIRRPVAEIVDAEQANAALVMVEQLRGRAA